MTLSTEILTRSPLLSADDLEGEIGNIIAELGEGPSSGTVSDSYDRPLPKGPMPDYVEHKEGVNQVGKLSAEAVVREYDAAVKEIEALGAELTEAAKKCEAMVAGVHCHGDRDQGIGGELSRGRQALLPADRGLFADDIRSPQRLRDAQEENCRR